MAKQKKEAKKAVAKAFKDNKVDIAEAQAISTQYGDKGIQAIAKGLASKKDYELGGQAAQFTGLRDKKDGVYFTPHLTDPLTPYWIGINGVGAGKPRSSTDSPGKGWVNVGTAGTQPRYRFVGQGYNNLGTGGGGGNGNGGNGNGGRADRGSGNYNDIMDALGEDRQGAKDWEQKLLKKYGINANIEETNLAQQIADSALAQQNGLNSLVIQQEQAYQQQLALQKQQMEAAQAAYAEQQRQASALAKAYVPDLNPTAYSPLVGDMRTSANSSTLSGLAILNGGSALAGLQIA